MEISDGALVAMISAIPTTLAAVGAMVVGLINGRKADKTQDKIDAVSTKATEIHTMTNSNLARVTSQLEVANEKLAGFGLAQSVSNSKIEGLETLVANFMRQRDTTNATAGVVAATAASMAAQGAAASVPNASAVLVGAKVDAVGAKVDLVEAKLDIVDTKVTKL